MRVLTKELTSADLGEKPDQSETVPGKESFDHHVVGRIGRLGRYADRLAIHSGDGTGIKNCPVGIDRWLRLRREVELGEKGFRAGIGHD